MLPERTEARPFSFRGVLLTLASTLLVVIGLQTASAGTARLVPALGTSVSAAPTAGGDCPAMLYTPGDRGKLFLNVCGPGKVIRGVSYGYEVVLTSKATHRKIKLTVIHQDPITFSSIPYDRAYRADYTIWTIRNFKQGHIFRVSFRLLFKQHNDPKGSNFMVGAVAYGPPVGDPGGFLSKDVTFIKKKK